MLIPHPGWTWCARYAKAQPPTTDQVVLEVLAGASDARRLAAWQGMLNACEFVPQLPYVDAESAARVYRTCRRAGETPRALADCLIAAIAIRTSATILPPDKDFDVITRYTTFAGRVGMIRLSDKVIADPPVVLAPMAGITNVAFRRLCREHGAGLYVSEMITSRALVERNPKTMRLIRFAPDERPRSLQLYGVDPAIVGAAVRLIVEDDLADHVDLNFGCPVPKVTRKGGGAALPWRMQLFAGIVTAAVRAADGAVPITVKMRLGIDREHLTYREAALRAQDAGVGHVALHGRTASDFLRRPGRLGADRRAGRTARHPGAGQRRHLGGRRRAAHGARDGPAPVW